MDRLDGFIGPWVTTGWFTGRKRKTGETENGVTGVITKTKTERWRKEEQGPLDVVQCWFTSHLSLFSFVCCFGSDWVVTFFPDQRDRRIQNFSQWQHRMQLQFAEQPPPSVTDMTHTIPLPLNQSEEGGCEVRAGPARHKRSPLQNPHPSHRPHSDGRRQEDLDYYFQPSAGEPDLPAPTTHHPRLNEQQQPRATSSPPPTPRRKLQKKAPPTHRATAATAPNSPSKSVITAATCFTAQPTNQPTHREIITAVFLARVYPRSSTRQHPSRKRVCNIQGRGRKEEIQPSDTNNTHRQNPDPKPRLARHLR